MRSHRFTCFQFYTYIILPIFNVLSLKFCFDSSSCLCFCLRCYRHIMREIQTFWHNWSRFFQAGCRCFCTANSVKTPPHTHTTVLRPFFRDHPDEPVPEKNFWTLWCKGRLTEVDTLTIRLGATASGLTSAHLHHPPIFFTDRMPFLPPNQQCQSTEGNEDNYALITIIVRGVVTVVGADVCLAGGSDKTVQVFDVNAARCVRLMTDVHTRAVHHIAQNQVYTAVFWRATHTHSTATTTVAICCKSGIVV